MDVNELLARVRDKEKGLNNQIVILENDEKRFREWLANNRPKLEALKSKVEKLSIVRGLLQATIDATTTANLRKTEEMVNTALQDIFPAKQNVKFSFTSETKRDITTIIPHLTVNNVIDGTLNTHGGGLIAPIAFVLRVLTNIFAGNLPLIVLDESLIHISAEYQIPTAKFIEILTRELGITVLLVTHQPLFSEQADITMRIAQVPEIRSTYIQSKSGGETPASPTI